MKKFSFNLENILEIRKGEQSQAEAELGKVNGEISRLNGELAEIAQKKANLFKNYNATDDFIFHSNSQNYKYLLDRRSEEIMQQIATLQIEADEKREILREAMKKVKSLEILKDRQFKQWKKEYQKEEEVVQEEAVQSKIVLDNQN